MSPMLGRGLGKRPFVSYAKQWPIFIFNEFKMVIFSHGVALILFREFFENFAGGRFFVFCGN